jgi:hypothetical protein
MTYRKDQHCETARLRRLTACSASHTKQTPMLQPRSGTGPLSVIDGHRIGGDGLVGDCDPEVSSSNCCGCALLPTFPDVAAQL